MRQRGSVNVIVYVPKAETCQAELSRRIASVHADAVIGQLQKLLHGVRNLSSVVPQQHLRG